MLGEKKYERAIKKKETIDFLLGIGEYHHPDGEFSSEFHTPSYTFLEIKEYGTKHGEVKMLKQFKDDIKKALRLDLTSDEFLTISTYIYIYMLGFYKENSIKIEWIPDEETRTLIKKHYNNFMDQFSSL
ncbi:MAG: hypothetical protein PSX42_14285, partial [bacterium]|nr:hypothetical protein [bacterium]